MNEKSIEASLKRVTAPAPDPEARLRAKRAALEEFYLGPLSGEGGVQFAQVGFEGFWLL